jgi:hypothetical protein
MNSYKIKDINYFLDFPVFIENLTNKKLTETEKNLIAVFKNNLPISICPTGDEEFVIKIRKIKNCSIYIEEEIHDNSKTFHPFSKFKGKEKPTRK